MPLKLLNWNVEWAAAKWKADGDAAPHCPARCGRHLSHRGRHGTFEALPPDGHSICAQDNSGSTVPKGAGGQTEGPAVVQSALEDSG